MSVRLFVEPDRLVEGDVRIDGPDHHYLFRVMRLTVGATVVLFDGAGRRGNAEVMAIDGENARLRVERIDPVEASSACSISVGLALIKGDRMEWCIQKLVELGAARIVPIQASRAVVKLSGDRAESRRQRWTSVARDAARQCRRTTVPEIAPVCSLPQALEQLGDADLKALLWAKERTRSLREAAAMGAAASAAVLVGPEGGWTSDEVDEAVAAGFEPVGIGPRVLRAETAAIAAVTALGLTLGDLG
jgi:16S rRNA (uracil1498-N3)-methyltransferase